MTPTEKLRGVNEIFADEAGVDDKKKDLLEFVRNAIQKLKADISGSHNDILSIYIVCGEYDLTLMTEDSNNRKFVLKGVWDEDEKVRLIKER